MRKQIQDQTDSRVQKACNRRGFPAILIFVHSLGSCLYHVMSQSRLVGRVSGRPHTKLWRLHVTLC